MPEPRIWVGRFSPMIQRSASRRLDFPQPFGPTTPVSPAEMTSSVGSTKDLNPFSLNRVNCTPASSFLHLTRRQCCCQPVPGPAVEIQRPGYGGRAFRLTPSCNSELRVEEFRSEEHTSELQSRGHL